MTCYSPLRGYRAREGRIVFKRSQAITGAAVDVACGQCIGCRLARSRTWALRCMHEASLYEDNCFITLTYANEYLPDGNTLVVKHFQDFMKRLRFRYAPRSIRFYACGEYGELFERPHYHALLFNWNFPDKYIWKKGNSGEDLQFKSSSLDELWPFGSSSIGTVTFKSAAYCSRYVMKKQTGEGAIVYQPHVNPITGVVYGERVPPFNLMSRRPGIGFGWYNAFKTDAFPSDFLVLDTRKVGVPRYYDCLYEREGGDLESIKKARRLQRLRYKDDRTPARLKVLEEVKVSQLNHLSREME